MPLLSTCSVQSPAQGWITVKSKTDEAPSQETIWSRDWQMFPVKGQIVNSFSLVDCMKATADDM